MLTGLFFIGLIAFLAVPATLISKLVCNYLRKAEKKQMRAQAVADMQAMNEVYNDLILKEIMANGKN